jgi:ABC-type multidrug transport system ATPase subunit
MNRSVTTVDHAISAASFTDGDALLRDTAARFMQAAVEGDLSTASSALSQLFQLRGRFPSWSFLRAVAEGKVKIVPCGKFYRLEDAAFSPILQSDFEAAIAACESFLGLPIPTLVVACVDQLSDLHLTIENFPGLVMIKISNRSSTFPDGLRYEIFHETAHSFLSCGVRLLDEGLACLVSDRFGDFEGDAEQPECTYSLRTLLSDAAGEGLFFEGAGIAFSEVNAIRRLGAKIIDTVHQRLGSRGVVNLFNAAGQASDEKELARIVEIAVNQSLESFHNVKLVQNTDKELPRLAKQTIFSAYQANDYPALNEIIETLEAARKLNDPAILDVLIDARITRAILQLNVEAKVRSEDFSRIDVLISEATELPEGRLLTLRGHRLVLEIKNEKGNFVKISSLSGKAMQAYERARRLIPDDPDLQIAHAHLLINIPQQYGGDKDRGMSTLRILSKDPFFGGYAKAVLGKFEKPSPQPTPMPEEPVAQAAADSAVLTKTPKPPVISVNGIRAKISDSFSLDIPALVIRQDEKTAFIGRNGSGKTILLETLLGLRAPDQGTAEICYEGTVIDSAPEHRKLLGGLLQNVGFFGPTYVREIVRMRKVMYGKDDGTVAKALGLDELMEKQYTELSRGQEQRVLLFLALAHKPRVALLDEPSLGLDEWYAQSLRGLWQRPSMTLAIISHIPADIEEMDRVIWIQDGSIIDDGSLPDLLHKYAGKFKARVMDKMSPQVIERIAKLPGLMFPPEEKDGEWHLFGDERLAAQFKVFVLEAGLSAFSIAPTKTEDFLSRITRN